MAEIIYYRFSSLIKETTTLPSTKGSKGFVLYDVAASDYRLYQNKP
jgi:hypothetical protein